MSDTPAPKNPAPAAPAAAAAPAPAFAGAPAARPNARRKALGLVGGAVVLAGIAYAAWWAVALRHVESTDNAYVAGNVVQITPQQAGTVVAIHADEADPVQAGRPLVQLDAADARVALDQARAQLARAVREVRGLYANNATLAAQVQLREAELARAGAELQRLQDDVQRRQPLVASGAIGREELAHATAQLTAARSAQAAAQSALAAAREALAAAQTQTDGTSPAEHPGVQAAAARVREAWLAQQRATLPAPIAGVVARRSVQIGQRVAAGTPLMTVVALDQLWVDANFKEGQLRRLRIGQPATLVADVYGQQVVFHGRVSGLGAGTGAAFALLPAQNATGNWIKVVQRVPVRIALDPKDLAAHPLRVGLSMVVSVDVSDTSGRTLADAPRGQPLVQTRVFESQQAAADAEVARVIQAHGGGGARPAAVQPALHRSAAPAAAGQGAGH